MILADDQAMLVFERGDDAKRLLADAVFTRVLNDLSNYHLAAMVATPPGPPGEETRNHHHLLTFALREIVDSLEGHVAAAAELRRRFQLDESEGEPFDSHEDFTE